MAETYQDRFSSARAFRICILLHISVLIISRTLMSDLLVNLELWKTPMAPLGTVLLLLRILLHAEKFFGRIIVPNHRLYLFSSNPNLFEFGGEYLYLFLFCIFCCCTICKLQKKYSSRIFFLSKIWALCRKNYLSNGI